MREISWLPEGGPTITIASQEKFCFKETIIRYTNMMYK
jgi:hypothetical protein